MKKIATLAVVFALTLAAIGCGTGATTSKAGTGATGGTTTPTEKK